METIAGSNAPSTAPIESKQIKYTWAHFLKEKLKEKIETTPRYSLRALARDMFVSPAYLSQCFNGKKNLSYARALQISQYLGLNSDEQSRLIDEVRSQSKRRTGDDETKSIMNLAKIHRELEWHRFLEHWYHVAILDLTTTHNFIPSTEDVAKRLSLTEEEVRNAVDLLIKLGLLKIEAGQWIKTPDRFCYPTEKSLYWVRKFHQQMIQKAMDQLTQKNEEKDFLERDITGMTMAIDPNKIPQAKKLIQKFRAQMANFLSSGPSSEVFQLNVQFFALSQKVSPFSETDKDQNHDCMNEKGALYQ